VKYDAIVIGTGQAGPPLAARLGAAGMKVAVIERAKFGGTCVNNGCIPTKTMVASAYAAQLARRAAEYGVNTGGSVSVDMKKVKARKDEISGKSNSGVEDLVRSIKTGTVYQGHARFESAHEISVGSERLSADRIFINVGGRAAIPAIPGLDQVPYLTNSSIMEVDFLPRHLLILGGSYIGLEFAQMYRRFGSEVTIIELGPRLIGREDPDISDAVLEIMRNEGINVHLNSNCLSFAKDGADIVATVECGGKAQVRGSHLLLAAGRRPNTDDLGLDRAGIKTDSRGNIQIDDQLQTNVPGVWALGDCNGKGGFTHTSYNDYEIVAGNLLDHDSRKVSDRIPTYALFIDPPLGRAGQTDAEVRKSGKKALFAKRPMKKVGRAVEKGETQGLMKIVIDQETKLILGAAILGTGGDEAIHSILDVMYAKKPYTVIQRAMHIHPTVSEYIPTILGELQPLT
jgi:pyruvate/2-oxoglutarate dehydrogenase complex dihydrolipoamide dehydrogenase (E3) component